MRRAGVAERVIMDIVGHETNAMFVRYNIVDELDTRDAFAHTQDYLKTQNQHTKKEQATKGGGKEITSS